MVRGTVFSHQPGAVDREDDRQTLQAHVVDDLIVGPLKERRIDGHHGPLAVGRQPRCQTDRVRFRDADVEEPIRERVLEKIQTRSCRPLRR